MIIKNKFIPFGKYSVINIFGILFTKRDNLPDFVINHEKIHSRQMIDTFLLFLFIIFLIDILNKFNINIFWYILPFFSFYVLYIFEYMIFRLLYNRQKDAYHDISFEEEAYNNQYDFTYLKRRKIFSFVKYMLPYSNK